MAQTIGSIDLASLKNLRDDVTQYFWFESNSSSAWGSGAHVTLYPESQFTNPNHANYLKGQNIIMNTDGFSIRNGVLPMMVLDNNSLDFNAVDTAQGTCTTMATFGSTGATIGQDGQTRVLQDYHSMKMIDKEGDVYFHVSDLRDQAGNVKETFLGDGANNAFAVGDTPIATIKVTIDDVETTNYTVTEDVYRFSTAPAVNAVIVIEYTPTNPQLAKAFTVGKRTQNQKLGFYSCAEGFNVTAGGNYSHAEGFGGGAMGYCSHSESNGVAHGDYSHGEGTSFAIGNYSHAQNKDTIAYSDDQTALGRYNDIDTNGQYAIIIGNGNGIIDDPNERSNALTVDWDGNVKTHNDQYTLVAVESGTDNGWTYRKYADGRMEAEKDITTGSSWSSVGSAGINYNNTSISPPTGMTVTSGFANLKSTSQYIIGTQVQVGTNLYLTVHRLASSSASFTCHVTLIGTYS